MQKNINAKPAPAQYANPALASLVRPLHTFSTTHSLSDINQKLPVTQPLLIQPKLTVGLPKDRYEQEADHVADTIMRMSVPDIQRKPT